MSAKEFSVMADTGRSAKQTQYLLGRGYQESVRQVFGSAYDIYINNPGAT